ncbi:MAG: lysostaphin resistance A-like protein [Planctomycetota bacterium]
MYWIKVTALLGGVVLAIVVAASAIAYACGVDPESHRLFRSPADFWPWIRHGCLVAPVLEEGIYRFVLCVPLVVLAGPRVAILASGCLFASLHFAYGNPAPDNFVAGFILSWAFLKSGSVILPVGLHCLGNLCVGLIQLLACYV